MDKTNSSIKRLISFFFEVGTLRKTLRSHRQTLLTDDLSDNIASHSHRVTMIGWFLATAEKADPYKVVITCLLHDLEESRCGDQNWVHKKFIKVFEEEIREGQLKPLPKSGELVKLSEEYQERKTLESRVAKDWLKGREQEKLMFTQTGKKLAQEAYRQRPSEWWDNLWTNSRR